MKQELGLIVKISMFSSAYKLKNKFQTEEEGIGSIFLWVFRSRSSSRLHKISWLNKDVLLQLVKNIINRVCYQRYEKRLEQQKVVQT